MRNASVLNDRRLLMAGWIVFTVLIIAIAFFALRACSFGLPFIGRSLFFACPAVASGNENAELLALVEQERVLRSELDSLRSRLASEPDACHAAAEHASADTSEAAPVAQQPMRTACAIPASDNVLLVMDQSLSMKWDFDSPPALLEREDRLFERVMAIDREIGNLQQQIGNNPLAAFQVIGRLSELQAERNEVSAQLQHVNEQLAAGPGIDRFDIAKNAVSELADAASTSVTFDLVTFSQCGAPTRMGSFPPSARNKLKQQTRGLRAKQSTALADAISALPEATGLGRTADKPLNVVLLSDGADSCGGDPCAAARQMKAQMPHAVISVVALAPQLGANACIANNTGGKFFQASDASKVAELIMDASGQGAAADCAPRAE